MNANKGSYQQILVPIAVHVFEGHRGPGGEINWCVIFVIEAYRLRQLLFAIDFN